MQRLRQLPSIVLIFLFVAGIAALIGGIIGVFYLISHVEGVASVIMIVVAWAIIRELFSDGYETEDKTEANTFQRKNVLVAVGITFFALMGVAIDQTGNAIYNKPIEWFFCPSATELRRGVEVSNPVPGETLVEQDYTCVTPKEHRFVERVEILNVLAVRFVEYVLIGYALLWLSRLYRGTRARFSSAPDR